MNLSLIVALCAALIVVAKVADFLLGKPGRKWVKEKVIFRSWYFLQDKNPLAILRTSASRFSTTINFVFGVRLISRRAYVASWATGMALVLLYVALDEPLQLSQFVAYEPSLVTFIGVMLVISPCFDFLSFAVTRYLANRIAIASSLLPALTLWFIDLLLCAILALSAYSTAEVFVNYTEPKFGLSIWFGLHTHDVSVFTAVSKSVPTVVHLAFFAWFLLLACLELLRVMLCYLLERFDEASESPLTIACALIAAVMGLLSAAVKVVSGG